MISLPVLLASMMLMFILWVRVVGINLSLSSVMMGGLLALHGPAYLYYTRSWGPGSSFMRDLYGRSHSTPELEPGFALAIPDDSINYFDHILSFAKDRNVISELDLALALLLVSFCGGLILSDRLLGTTPTMMRASIRAWGHAQMRPISQQWLPWIMAVLTAAATVMLIVALRGNQIGTVEQYFLSNAGEFAKIAMRRALGGSPHYLYNLTLAAILPLLTFWALALIPQWPRRIAPIALFMTAVVLLGKLALLSKAPPRFLLPAIDGAGADQTPTQPHDQTVVGDGNFCRFAFYGHELCSEPLSKKPLQRTSISVLPDFHDPE